MGGWDHFCDRTPFLFRRANSETSPAYTLTSLPTLVQASPCPHTLWRIRIPTKRPHIPSERARIPCERLESKTPQSSPPRGVPSQFRPPPRTSPGGREVLSDAAITALEQLATERGIGELSATEDEVSAFGDEFGAGGEAWEAGAGEEIGTIEEGGAIEEGEMGGGRGLESARKVEASGEASGSAAEKAEEPEVRSEIEGIPSIEESEESASIPSRRREEREESEEREEREERGGREERVGGEYIGAREEAEAAGQALDSVEARVVEAVGAGEVCEAAEVGGAQEAEPVAASESSAGGAIGHGAASSPHPHSSSSPSPSPAYFLTAAATVSAAPADTAFTALPAVPAAVVAGPAIPTFSPAPIPALRLFVGWGHPHAPPAHTPLFSSWAQLSWAS